jgi:hypothetical protein
LLGYPVLLIAQSLLQVVAHRSLPPSAFRPCSGTMQV